jgi:hypothetical protein
LKVGEAVSGVDDESRLLVPVPLRWVLGSLAALSAIVVPTTTAYSVGDQLAEEMRAVKLEVSGVKEEVRDLSAQVQLGRSEDRRFIESQIAGIDKRLTLLEAASK